MRRFASIALLLIATATTVAAQPPMARERPSEIENRVTARDLPDPEIAPLSYAAAREISNQALALQGAARWSDAVNLLRQALSRCATGDAGRSCRALLNYSLGYCFEQQAAADGGSDDRALLRAAAYYNRVLEDQPDHPATLRNLAAVARRQADPQTAERALRAALFGSAAEGSWGPLQPTAIAGDALRLGELVAQRGDYPAALRAYRLAAQLDPAAATPRRRVLDHYSRESSEPAAARTAAVLEELADWGEQFPEEARQGYSWVVEVALDAEPPARETAERALLALVDLLASQDRLNRQTLTGLPSGWEPVADLELYLETGSWGDGGWWLADRRREEILARVALAAGKRWLAATRDDGERAQAARRTEACWASATSRAPDFELGPGWMDLFTDLAALYTDRRAELDPDGRKFERLEEHLFGGKGEAYRTNDLAAIQRFHTVLGLIYADRETWTSNSRYRNAVFQLDRAIKTADRRAQQEGAPYQPLARLKDTLAAGYVATGDRESAYQTYLEAAEAYLDNDSVDTAAKMLQAGRRIGPASARNRQREDTLETVVELRTMTAGTNAVCPETPTNWQPLRASGLDPAFASRQQFKVLADCAKPGPLGLPDHGLALAALKVALEDEITLVGAADLYRIRTLEQTLADSSLDLTGHLAPRVYQVKSTLNDRSRAIEVDIQQPDARRLLAVELRDSGKVDG